MNTAMAIPLALLPAPSSAQRRRRGLTLIELAIAIAVLAILSAIALPSLSAQLAHRRLHGSAQALMADLSEARFEAARRGSALHLQARSGPDWCWAVVTIANCPCGSPQPCQLQHVRASEHAGVTLSSSAEVAFDPAAAAGPARTVALLENRQGEKLKVEMSALGRPRLCAVAGSWPQLPPC